jgi:hypothetical protein
VHSHRNSARSVLPLRRFVWCRFLRVARGKGGRIAVTVLPIAVTLAGALSAAHKQLAALSPKFGSPKRPKLRQPDEAGQAIGITVPAPNSPPFLPEFRRQCAQLFNDSGLLSGGSARQSGAQSPQFCPQRLAELRGARAVELR